MGREPNAEFEKVNLQCLRCSICFVILACVPACFAQANPAAPPAQVQSSAYNPMLAAHDVQVGKFYMKRGDRDGAIARFKDALLHNPDYAEPCLLLGRAYEQKHDLATAIHYYQQYLKILPNTSESKKVRKRIAELQDKMKKDEPGSAKERSLNNERLRVVLRNATEFHVNRLRNFSARRYSLNFLSSVRNSSEWACNRHLASLMGCLRCSISW